MSVFGEVELGVSRAVFDEEDDEVMPKEDETLKRKIYWLNGEEKITADQLLLADGPSSAAFIYTYLISHFTQSSNMRLLALSATLSEYKVYQVNNESAEELKKTTPTFRSNYIYLINNLNGKNYVICQLFDQLKHNELYDWIAQLASRVEFKQALLFCSQDKSQYLSQTIDTVPFVKCLASDKTYTSCARLEPPNFVSGLPAASYIAADMQSVKEIYNVASKRLKENNIFIDNEYTKKSLLALRDIVSSATALYM